ncbi:MAG TPA: SdrD B-like domain-containing protein [Steroidobacteraceae bacterium]|nr:SdrD B-like domain-containing protein [Steroidobacteraceae bacterium]
MKLRGNLARRLAFCLCGLGGFVYSSAAHAEIATPTSAAASSAVNPPAPPQYQDRYIGGGSLVPDISTGDEGTSNAQGLARSLELDGVASVLRSHGAGSDANVMENGVIARAQWETVAYGAWSLDASARTGGSNLGPSEQGQGGVVSLRQRGMPFDGGWQADNALGDLNTPDISLARIQPRFYLPTAPIQGLATEWRGPSGLQVVAGGGVPGLYDGIEVPNFRTLSGSTATAGAEWSPASQWTVGAQFIEAHDVNLAVGPVIDGATLMSSSTGLLSAAWADRGEHVQLNLLDGGVSGKTSSVGAWVDGSIAQGRFLQNAGLFRIDPNVTWGNQLISNDAQGGYYRLNYQSRQWLADVGIDEVRSVSGLGTNTIFVTGDTRYQMSRDLGLGGVANISHSDGGTGWSLEGYLDHANAGGTGRAQADFAETPAGRDTTLTLNETWSTPVGFRLSTGASVERISGTVINDFQQDSTVLSIAAFGGGQFTGAFGVEGNVRWARAVQGQAAPGVFANVSLTWQLSRTWEILATYYDSRIGTWSPLTVVSPLTPPVAMPVPAVQERGMFLTFRYRRASGSHFAPLGGAPGAGSGEIAGIVFLDANNNGHADAGEAGAPNVTVVLDGRFSMQTDAAGRFDFPVVAAGRHIITVIPDNLPLPWTLVNEGRSEVEVMTRGRTEIGIAAQRPR